jgi:alkylation response protein AidB-like acyl-CoA dehydrogenase
VTPEFSSEERAFREEVLGFLADWRDLDGFHFQGRRWPRVREFFRAVGQRGWLALGWPGVAGGPCKGPVPEFILWNECAYARIARPPLGAGIVAKTILQSGTDAQRARWLPPIRAGEIHFSLGYSEPEAGSDLTSVRTRAERQGDAYIVHGQKCWTSYAQDSDYLWLLCRTGAQESRGDGLSLLIVDLHAPGVRVAPLPLLDDEPLHEIMLDGVQVPVENRIGHEHGAWKLMHDALAVERHVQFPPGRVRRDLEDLAAFVHDTGLARDAHVRHIVADLAVLVCEVEMHALRVLEAAVKGRISTLEAAANKVAHTEACQRIARAALEIGGPEALVRGTTLEFLYRQSTWETIGGGTSEMMRGVVAKQGLGLGSRRSSGT